MCASSPYVGVRDCPSVILQHEAHNHISGADSEIAETATFEGMSQVSRRITHHVIKSFEVEQVGACPQEQPV